MRADTIVGTVFRKGISGGQQRRVLVGTELFANPSILLCDGLTNGLDSAAAYNIVKHLRSLAQVRFAPAFPLCTSTHSRLALSAALQ